MPSRKRNKGKERKARKAELEVERIKIVMNERAEVHKTWTGYVRGVDEDGQVINQCNHGCGYLFIPDVNHPVTSFLDDFFAGEEKTFYSTFQPHYHQVWENDSYRKLAINILISVGTNLLLKKRTDGPNDIARAILVLENYAGNDIHAALRNRGACAKLRDLGERRTIKRDLLKFYRKRTTVCSCLKRMHLEARKTFPKLGKCTHCKEVKERRLLMVCSRCRIAQYCSRVCQIADWPRHKCEECYDYLSEHINSRR